MRDVKLVRYERYGRYWAVYEDDALLCVTVYKKGALAVIERLKRSEPRWLQDRPTPRTQRVIAPPSANPRHARKESCTHGYCPQAPRTPQPERP